MYVMESRISSVGGQLYSSDTLHEVQPKELFSQINSDTHRFVVINASRAHKFVREGGHHTTGLWVDGNRIRKSYPE